MKEKTYLLLRKIFFWLSFLAFFVSTPLVVFYSLGYKFNFSTKKFIKTGVIAVKTNPREVNVYLDNKKIEKLSPCVIRELLPGEYAVLLEKEGFYPYQLTVNVKPSLVSEIDVVLISRQKEAERINLEFDIQRFFVIKHILGEKILAFTDKGVYLLDSDFKDAKEISSTRLSKEELDAIEGFKTSNNRIVFWDRNNLRLLELPEFPEFKERKDKGAILIYQAEAGIRDIFFGLKDRYLIIHDGLKVIVLDIQNPGTYFDIWDLKSRDARIFYNSRSEVLYINDKDSRTHKPVFFKMGLMPLIHERKEIEKNP